MTEPEISGRIFTGNTFVICLLYRFYELCVVIKTCSLIVCLDYLDKNLVK